MPRTPLAFLLVSAMALGAAPLACTSSSGGSTTGPGTCGGGSPSHSDTGGSSHAGGTGGSAHAGGTGGAGGAGPVSATSVATSSTGGIGSCPGDGQSCVGSAVGSTCQFGDEPAYECVCTQTGSTQQWQCMMVGPGSTGVGSGGASGAGGHGGTGGDGGA